MDVYDKFKDKENDYDYDLISRQGASVAAGNEKHAVTKRPAFVDSAGGVFRLAKGSSGIDAGLALPDVNDGYVGKAPEMGAFESGASGVIPHRPSGMLARPQRMMLKGLPGEKVTRGAEIVLTVPKSAGAKWTARPNAPWIVCEPASGRTGDGPQKVTVRGKLDGLDYRLYRGAVTFRTDRGFNRTITVNLKVYRQPFVKFFEAEAGKLTGGFEKVADQQASGGFYVCTPQPKAGEKEPKPGTFVFAFAVPADGTYYVAARCLVPKPSGSHDSFFFAMDGARRGRWDVHAGPYRWSWSMLNQRGGEATTVARRFKLTKGKHRLTITSRELDTRLDCLTITNNPYPEPPLKE